MAHILSSFLTFHWAAAFFLLAVVCVMGGDGGLLSGLEMLGVVLSQGAVDSGAQPAAAGFFAVAFAICCALFLWAFLSSMLNGADGETEQVTRIAFGVSVGALSLLVLYGATQPLVGLYPVIGVQLAALLASYLAIVAEHRSAPDARAPAADDLSSAVRIMAINAANNSLLARLSGRPASNRGGVR